MFMAHVTTEICADAWCLSLHLRPCWCPRVMLPPGPNRTGWPELAIQIHSASSQSCVCVRGPITTRVYCCRWLLLTIKGRVTTWSIGHHLGPCWSPGTMLLLGPSRRPVLTTKGHGDIRVQAAAAGPVWAHGPAASGFYVDVRCHRVHTNHVLKHVLKYEGHQTF